MVVDVSERGHDVTTPLFLCDLLGRLAQLRASQCHCEVLLFSDDVCIIEIRDDDATVSGCGGC